MGILEVGGSARPIVIASDIEAPIITRPPKKKNGRMQRLIGLRIREEYGHDFYGHILPRKGDRELTQAEQMPKVNFHQTRRLGNEESSSFC